LSKVIRAISALCVVALAIGCGEDEMASGPEPPLVGSITVISGDAQAGTVNEELPAPVVLGVVDNDGGNFAGVEVLVSPTDDGTVKVGGASASGAGSAVLVEADDNGEVRVTWRLTPMAGFTGMSARAAASGQEDTLEVFVTATAEPGPLANVIQEGNNQAAAAGQALARPVAVLVVDALGNPLADVDVTWAVISGSGTLSAVMSPTDDSGRSSAEWTLGPGTGDQRVSANVSSGGGIVIFNAVAL
jgi:hypothetical protein